MVKKTEERKELTPREQELIRFICKHIDKKRMQPSQKEMGDAIGSANPVALLRQLEIKGWIKSSGVARAIEISEQTYKEVLSWK